MTPASTNTITARHLWRGLTLALLAFAPSCLVAQTSTPLALDVKLQHSSVPIRGALAFVAIISNTTQAQRVALRGARDFSEGGGLKLTIIDADGQSTEMAETKGMSLQEAATGSIRQVLDPGEGVGLYFRVKISDLTDRPGAYTLQLNYQSPTPTPGNVSIEPGVVEGAVASPASIAFEVNE